MIENEYRPLCGFRFFQRNQKLDIWKLTFWKIESGKVLNFSTDYAKSDHHKVVNQAS